VSNHEFKGQQISPYLLICENWYQRK